MLRIGSPDPPRPRRQAGRENVRWKGANAPRRCSRGTRGDYRDWRPLRLLLEEGLDGKCSHAACRNRWTTTARGPAAGVPCAHRCWVMPRWRWKRAYAYDEGSRDDAGDIGWRDRRIQRDSFANTAHGRLYPPSPPCAARNNLRLFAGRIVSAGRTSHLPVGWRIGQRHRVRKHSPRAVLHRVCSRDISRRISRYRPGRLLPPAKRQKIAVPRR